MKRKRRRKAQPRKQSKRRGLLRRVVSIGILAAVALVTIYGAWALLFDMDDLGVMPQRSGVYDMDGKFYSRLHGENRIKVPLDRVSKHFIDALLVREDSRFYYHPGIDPIGIARAIVRNISRHSVKEGASTLTQQLARNSFSLGGRTLNRKILEAFVALRIEYHFSKDEILEYYVNRIYFGSGYWGVETASQAYFGKPASRLNLSEAAMLVGLIRSPNRFSPFNNLKGALAERDTVLGRMRQEGVITEAEQREAEHWKPRIAKSKPFVAQENYAMDAVQRELDILLREQQLEEGGLKIYTTIDPALQNKARTALGEVLSEIESRPGYKHPTKSQFTEAQRKAGEEPEYLQGAVLVFDNRSGGIRALVGGRDYRESKFNRALPAMRRQVGSTFKPFVYTAAYGNGLLPGGLIDDSRIGRGELRTVSGAWSPANSDGKYGGPLPAEQGLIRSRNTMSVRVGDRAGVSEVQRMAASVGIADVPENPAIFLGAFEASLQEMVVAYSVFPNNGLRRQPYLIERIDDQDGNVLYRAAHVQAQAIDPGLAWMTSTALEKVVENGTATRARALGFRKPAGGKTGTTNDYRDAWFIGYTTSLSCGVWVGLDRPSTIMSRGYGSTLALPVWTAVMASAPGNRYPADSFKPAVPLQNATVCAVSNQLATTGCQSAHTAYTIALPTNWVPVDFCEVHQGRLVKSQRKGQGTRDSFPTRAFRSFKKLFGQ